MERRYPLRALRFAPLGASGETLTQLEEHESVRFSDDFEVHGGGQSIPLRAVKKQYGQVSLSSTGYYATPGIQYDPQSVEGVRFSLCLAAPSLRLRSMV